MTLKEQFENDTGCIEPKAVSYKDVKYYQELSDYLDERVEWLENRITRKEREVIKPLLSLDDIINELHEQMSIHNVAKVYKILKDLTNKDDGTVNSQ